MGEKIIWKNVKELSNVEQQFTTVIKPKQKLLDLKLGELWRYRDLILLFTKRSFVVTYKQTILGPAWIFLNPLISLLQNTLIKAA